MAPRKWFVFVIVLLVVFRSRAQNVAAGFGSQTQYASCTDYQGNIDCGNTENNVTVVELSLVPGTGQEVSYIVRSVSNVASSSDLFGGGRTCPAGGTCSVVNEYRITLRSSPMLSYYTYYPLGTRVPHFYAAFHSNTMNIATNGKGVDNSGSGSRPSDTCQGWSGVLQYNLQNKQPTCKDGSSVAPAASLGIPFGRLCYANQYCGAWKTNKVTTANDQCITAANPPIPEYSNLMDKCLARVPYPYSAGCIDANNPDGSPVHVHKQCGAKVGKSGGTFYTFCGEQFDNIIKSGLCMSRIKSPVNPAEPTTCPNMMVKAPSIDYLVFPTPLMDYKEYVWNPSTNPITKYARLGDICGKPLSSIDINDYNNYISNMWYRQCVTQVNSRTYIAEGCNTLGPDWYLIGGFGPNALFEKGMNVMYSDPDKPDGPWITGQRHGEPQNDRCQRTFGALSDCKVCSMYYGGYQYQGYVTSDKLPSDCAVAMQQRKPQTPMLANVSPVIIGCWPDPVLSPVEFADATECNVSAYPTFGGRAKDLTSIALCGNNDFFCCSGKLSRSASKSDYVPMAVCPPSLGCNIDRLGVVDVNPVDNDENTDNFWNNGIKHHTIDTMGMAGPYCQVGSVAPAAQPYYEITMTIERLVPGQPDEFISNVTTSNVLFQQQYNEIFGDEAASTRTQAQQFRFFNNDNLNTAPNGTVASLRIIGLQTLTGQFAPDFENLNILICNTSTPDTNSFGPIYMTDPANPTANPWVKIDEALNKPLGGYTPIARNLYPVTSTVPGNGNPYPWFAFSRPQDFGTTCGALGMTSAFYEDSSNANYVCQGGRYRCVPGWIEGLDWTVEDRATDEFYSGGTKERELRRALKVHTPCVILNYFKDYETQQTCGAFRYYDGQLLQHLPPTWVNDGSGGKCPLPRCWVNGFQIFCDNTGVSSNDVRVRVQVAMLGTVLRSESVVSTGQFYISDSKPLTCAVDVSSTNGILSVYVKNTGQYSGVYGIYGNCTGGVSITFTQTKSIDPYSIQQVEVTVSQQGVISDVSPSCDLTLTNPTYRSLVFDSIHISNCTVLLPQDVINTASGRQASVCELSVDCQVYTDLPTATTAGIAAGTIVWITLITVLLGMLIGICILSGKNEVLKAKLS